MPLICLSAAFYVRFRAISNRLYIGFESRRRQDRMVMTERTEEQREDRANRNRESKIPGPGSRESVCICVYLWGLVR